MLRCRVLLCSFEVKFHAMMLDGVVTPSLSSSGNEMVTEWVLLVLFFTAAEKRKKAAVLVLPFNMQDTSEETSFGKP